MDLSLLQQRQKDGLSRFDRLRKAGTFGARLETAQVAATGTPIFAQGGDDPLFVRYPLTGAATGYVDIAVQPWLGDPVLSVVEGAPWQPDVFEATARQQMGHAVERWEAYSACDAAMKSGDVWLAPNRRLGGRYVELRKDEIGVTQGLSRQQREENQRQYVALAGAEAPPAVPAALPPVGLAGAPPVAVQPAGAEVPPVAVPLPGLGEVLAPPAGLVGVPVPAAGPVGAPAPPVGLVGVPVPPAGPAAAAPFAELSLCPLAAGGGGACVPKLTQTVDHWCVPAVLEMAIEYFLGEQQENRYQRELAKALEVTPLGMPNRALRSIPSAVSAVSGAQVSCKVTASAWCLVETEIGACRPMVTIAADHAFLIYGYTEVADGAAPPVAYMQLVDPWGGVTRTDAFSIHTADRAVQFWGLPVGATESAVAAGAPPIGAPGVAAPPAVAPLAVAPPVAVPPVAPPPAAAPPAAGV